MGSGSVQVEPRVSTNSENRRRARDYYDKRGDEDQSTLEESGLHDRCVKYLLQVCRRNRLKCVVHRKQPLANSQSHDKNARLAVPAEQTPNLGVRFLGVPRTA